PVRRRLEKCSRVGTDEFSCQRTRDETIVHVARPCCVIVRAPGVVAEHVGLLTKHFCARVEDDAIAPAWYFPKTAGGVDEPLIPDRLRELQPAIQENDALL